MAESLYRKYRPQTFSDLIGQEHVRITLENQIKSDTVGHAYLFTGPRGVGKTTSARLLAKAVNCVKRGKKPEPCNKCDACLEITGGRSLDVIEIDAASHTGVDNVRENIIENVRFAPTQRKFKVFIIDEVHMLSTSAFNALLKTLEEPPDHAMFILATTEIHKVPQTIISRCQRFDFKRITTPVLVKRLKKISKAEGIEVAEDVLTEVARHADGGQRDAESLLSQIFALGETKISMDEASLVLPSTNIQHVLTLVSAIGEGNAQAAIRHVNELVNDGVDIHHFIDDSIDYVRALMIAKLGGGETVFENYSDDVKKRSEEFLQTIDLRTIATTINELLEARHGHAAIVQLPLELAIVKLCPTDESLPKAQPANEGQPVKRVEADIQPEIAPEPVSPSEPSRSGVEGPEVELEPVSAEEVKELLVESEIALPVDSISGDHVEFKTVKGKWSEISERVQAAHASLAFLLNNCELLACDNNEVRLGFNFKFHADTMNAVKNAQVVETIMQKVLGSKVRVRGEYVHADSDVVVGDLVSEFGGKVVE